MPGPESSVSSARAPPSVVVLKRVITSPALRPAFSAGPPGVTPSIRAPILSPAASARVSTTTPMRPRLPLKEYTPSGPVCTRTRGPARPPGRAMTAEHASVDVVLLQGIFERSGLLFRLGQLGVQVAALAEDRRLNQQDTGE